MRTSSSPFSIAPQARQPSSPVQLRGLRPFPDHLRERRSRSVAFAVIHRTDTFALTILVSVWQARIASASSGLDAIWIALHCSRRALSKLVRSLEAARPKSRIYRGNHHNDRADARSLSVIWERVSSNLPRSIPFELEIEMTGRYFGEKCFAAY